MRSYGTVRTKATATICCSLASWTGNTQVYKDRDDLTPRDSRGRLCPRLGTGQRKRAPSSRKGNWGKGGGCPKGTKQQPPVERFCIECGQQFFLRWPKESARHGGRRYCTSVCAQRHKWNAKAPSPWRRKLGERRWAENRSRQRLREMLPAEPCEVCGTTQKIHRHHRDHDPMNNARENIAFLCEPHHIELHQREWNEQPF